MGRIVQLCQRNGVTPEQCRQQCDDLDECVGYNPKSFGSWCFIHYKDTWDGGSWTDVTLCFFGPNPGPVGKANGDGGGTCYRKEVPAERPRELPPTDMQRLARAVKDAQSDAKEARDGVKHAMRENEELRAKLKDSGQPTHSLNAGMEKLSKADLDRFPVASSTEKAVRARSWLQKQWKSKGPPPTGGRTFDISINSFKRDKFLEHSIKEYVRCHKSHGGKTSLNHIWAIWNDNSRPIPKHLQALADKHNEIFTFYKPQGEDRISNRFWPIDYKSEAVFHVDDDMLHMCPLLEDMFEIWRTDPDGMVGTSPRNKNMLEGGLDCWACPIIWGEYNIVFLTKGAFVHRRFFEEYWKPFWKPIRDEVDKYKCAEDFLMSAIHASQVGPGHTYAIAGSVNKGKWMVKETRHMLRALNMVEEFSGLNTRTWGVRGFAADKIAEFLKKKFPEEGRKGYFTTVTKQWWRSNVNADMSCREQTIACYNRAWDMCAAECDHPVRGNSACFTGDSACYAGSHMGTPMDWGEQDQLVCVGEKCAM